MPTPKEVLARHRVALWFTQPRNPLHYKATVHRAWAAVSRAIPWGELAPSTWPLVPVFHGNSKECPFPESDAVPPSPCALVFGIPEADNVAVAERALGAIDGPATILGVAALRHDQLRQGLPLMQYITHGTVISLGGWYANEPGVLLDSGLQVVTLDGDEERIQFDWNYSDFDAVGPHLMRVIGRNLRRWIKEPRRDEPPERFAAHGLELLWAGAPTLAGVVGGLALERALRLRLALDGDGERERIEQLGSLIKQAKVAGVISPEVAARMFKFKEVRNVCAHAVGTDDRADVADEVADFLRWLGWFLTSPESPGPAPGSGIRLG